MIMKYIVSIALCMSFGVEDVLCWQDIKEVVKFNYHDILINKLVSDFMINAKGYNYIYVNFMDHDVHSGYQTCELYSLLNLDVKLSRRNKQRVYSDIWSTPNHNINTLKYVRILNAARSSKDIFFLQPKFYKDTKSIINTITKFNKECLIVVLTSDDEQFKIVKQMLLTTEIFNIYLLKPGLVNISNYKLYFLYEICAFCDSGVHAIRMINKWTYGHGFSSNLLLGPSFKGNFHNSVVKVGIKHPSAPFAFPYLKNGKLVYGGNEYWQIKTIVTALHGKLMMINPSDGDHCTVTNSTYTGYCKLLLDEKVIMAGFPMPIQSMTFQFMDPTAIYHIEGFSIISAMPPLKSQQNAFFSSLQPIVLIYIFVSYLAVTLTLIVVRRLSNSVQSEHTVMTTAISMFSIISFESTQVTKLSTSEMLLIGVWIISCMFVISGVFGEITSVSSSEPAPARKPIDSVDDMKTLKMSWITPNTFSINILDKRLPNLVSKSKRMDVATGLKYVLDHPLQYVYLYSKIGGMSIIKMKFWNGQGQNPFHFGDGTGVSPYIFTIIVAKGSPYRKAITKTMMHMEGAGLFRDKYLPDAIEIISKFGKAKPKTNAKFKTYFTMEQLSAALTVLGAGTTISFLAFIAEIIFRFLKNYY